MPFSYTTYKKPLHFVTKHVSIDNRIRRGLLLVLGMEFRMNMKMIRKRFQH
jgi:hypothetical protein